jgi:hypothetical protein
MKRFLALIAAAGVAVGLYAAAAPGGQQGVTPAQIRTLQAQVKKLQKDMKNVKGALSCITVAGAAEFGDNTSAGYHYKQPDGTEVLTSAVDLTAQGETPQFYLATIDSQCIQGKGLTFAHVNGARLQR